MKKILSSCVMAALVTQLVVSQPTFAEEMIANIDSAYECCCTEQTVMNELHEALLEKKTVELQQELGISPMRLMPDSANFKLIPSTGNVNMLVLPITYAEYPERAALFDRDWWQELFFAPYDSEAEMLTLSLRGFYYQASYGKLDIDGTVLPAYSAPLTHIDYDNDSDLRQQMYIDALTYYCDQGLDISQFDNDGDGIIDALIICELRAFRRGSNMSGVISRLYGEINVYQFSDYARILGIYYGDLTLGGYPYGVLETVNTCMHEVGHLLGLPDNYNVADATNIIDGRIWELMSGGRYINSYYKYLLDWIDPIVLTNEDERTVVDLTPVDQFEENLDGRNKAVVLIPELTAFPFAEYYMAEYRTGGMMWDPRGNLLYDKAPGIVIWHCNTYVDTSHVNKAYVEYRNYLKPVYKSGAESGTYREEDIYVAGDEFSSDTSPSSDFYDGSHTGAFLRVEEITPDKAAVLVGFKDPNLLPGPIVEVSTPSKKILRKGETATILLTTKAGDELVPIDEKKTKGLHHVSTSGTVTVTAVAWSALKNPMTVTFSSPVSSTKRLNENRPGHMRA